MRISSAFPSNYLKASDLQGHEPTVTIARVAMETVGDDHKPILYFQGKEKGVVLNKTNANNIAMLYGDETESWTGKPITLYSTWVDFQGKSVEAIRVRPPKNHHQQSHQAPPPPPEQNGDSHGGPGLDDEIPF
ncbi:MAG: hypothetical protein ACTS10_21810 [Kiloniellales bacterium]